MCGLRKRILQCVNKNQTAISYDCTLVIKGIAILMMVFHHCFAFPSGYIEIPEYLTNDYLEAVAKSAKLCVCIFAFLTGWTYYRHEDKSVKYSTKKIISFLANYWITIIPIILFANFFCDYKYSIKLLGEFIPIFHHPLMKYAWYAWFYILMLSVFPIFNLIESKKQSIWRHIFFVIILTSILLFSNFIPGCSSFFSWFPCAIVGYFFGKFSILEWCIERISFKPAICIMLACFLLLASLYLTYIAVWFQPTKDLYLIKILRFFAAPPFILGILILHNIFNTIHKRTIIQLLGFHSMNIWFIHCIFHSSVTMRVVQPIVYFWDNPAWIFCITITTSLAISAIIQPMQQYINKQVLPQLFSLLKL